MRTLTTLLLSMIIATFNVGGVNLATQWLDVSKGLYDNNSYDLALLAAEKSLQANQSNSEYWYQKGIVLVAMGRYEYAIQYYDKAIEIDPMYASAWYEKGKALDGLGRYAEAIFCYDQVIDCYENGFVKNITFTTIFGETIERSTRYMEADALNSKGIGLRRLGDHKEAINCYDRSIDITKRFIEEESRPERLAASWNNKGSALLYLGGDNESIYRESIECFDNALALVPDNPVYISEAVYNKGLAWMFLKNYSNAINCFDEAIAVNGSNAWAAWFSKGIALEKLGNYESADFAFKMATELSGGKSFISLRSTKDWIVGLQMSLKMIISGAYAGIF